MIKSGMAQLLESLVPPEVMQQVKDAAIAVPQIAKKVGETMTRIEGKLDELESITNEIYNTVMRIENKVRGDDPPESTPLSLMATNGEHKGPLPESLQRLVEKDG